MKGPRASVVLVVVAACVLVTMVQGVGTWREPYAPNNWVFSHVVLANVALEDGVFPLNERFFVQNDFQSTRVAFQEETHLPALSLYAKTAWHFWNGIPLHPALVTSLALLSGFTPEDVTRLPVGAVALVLIAFATARRVLHHESARADPRFAIVTPVLLAVVSAPLALESRALMPSVTLVFPAFLAFAMMRHALVRDPWLLRLAVAPLFLLAFWYYTVAYFVILVFAGFLLARVIARVTRAHVPPRTLLPLAPALAVPVVLAAALFMNGALSSHLQMTSVLSDGPLVDPEASEDLGLDYGTHLYRQPWRSVALYAAGLVLASGLLVVATRVLADVIRKRAVPAVDAVLAQWVLGASVFTVVIVSITNASFLNRTVIYLTPVALIALVRVLAESARVPDTWGRLTMPASVAAVAFLLVVTPVFVYTATPRYAPGDTHAFEWMHENVPQDAVVYGPMEAVSPLLRAHGFTRGTAFHPTPRMVDAFWYGTDPGALVPYLASVQYVVLRADQRVNGFEDFSPAREPLPEDATLKFAASRDLHRAFDNGDVTVYRTALDPANLRRAPVPR